MSSTWSATRAPEVTELQVLDARGFNLGQALSSVTEGRGIVVNVVASDREEGVDSVRLYRALNASGQGRASASWSARTWPRRSSSTSRSRRPRRRVPAASAPRRPTSTVSRRPVAAAHAADHQADQPPRRPSCRSRRVLIIDGQELVVSVEVRTTSAPKASTAWSSTSTACRSRPSSIRSLRRPARLRRSTSTAPADRRPKGARASRSTRSPTMCSASRRDPDRAHRHRSRTRSSPSWSCCCRRRRDPDRRPEPQRSAPASPTSASGRAGPHAGWCASCRNEAAAGRHSRLEISERDLSLSGAESDPDNHFYVYRRTFPADNVIVREERAQRTRAHADARPHAQPRGVQRDHARGRAGYRRAPLLRADESAGEPGRRRHRPRHLLHRARPVHGETASRRVHRRVVDRRPDALGARAGQPGRARLPADGRAAHRSVHRRSAQ